MSTGAGQLDPPNPDSPAQPLVALSIGRSDHRPFRGGTATDERGDPVTRLARYTPAGLVPVTDGDLVEVERVYVFVHGWTPGSAVITDLVFAEAGRPAPAWDDRISDMSGIPLVAAYSPLLAALAARDPQAAVLWYSWVDQSATEAAPLSARESLRRTEINGRRLAGALVLATTSGPGLSSRTGMLPQIHLIGHSHGCVVATHAALTLEQPPAQLTLLDCPEDWFSRAGGAAGLLTDVLPRLHPGRGADGVFVDAYASMFGTPYHSQPGLSAVVDVRLAAPIRIGDDRGAIGYAHEYAVGWYAETVSDPQATSGFGWSLLAPRPADAPPFDPQDLASGYFVVAHNRPIENSSRVPPSQAESERVPLALGELRLTPTDPDVAIAVHLPGMHLVEFDYQLTRPGRRTRVEAAVNRVLVFAGGSGATQVPASGRYLLVPPNPDPNVPTLLQFRLTDAGRRSNAVISNLAAVRTASAGRRNFDMVGTSTALTLVGAAAGSLATLAVIGVGLGLRRVLRGLRG